MNSDNTVGVLARDLKAANFTNCIIEGNQSIEFFLEKSEGTLFNYNFKNNLLKFDDTNDRFKDNPLFDFTDNTKYQNNIFNGNPDFKNTASNSLIIGQESDAINKADTNASVQVPFDILGVSRLASPDIGAYQHIIFEEN